MSPLQITHHQRVKIGIATSDNPVSLPDGSIAFWSESSSRAWVESSTGQVVRQVSLPRVGDYSDWDMEVHISPIEAGEPTTPVRWPVRIERVGK